MIYTLCYDMTYFSIFNKQYDWTPYVEPETMDYKSQYLDYRTLNVKKNEVAYDELI